jgi:hypothetical protein
MVDGEDAPVAAMAGKIADEEWTRMADSWV